MPSRRDWRRRARGSPRRGRRRRSHLRGGARSLGPRAEPLGTTREPRRAAIDGDDALVERRQQRQERAFAGARIDRERAAGQQRARRSRASRRASRRFDAGATTGAVRDSSNSFFDSSSRCATTRATFARLPSFVHSLRPSPTAASTTTSLSRSPIGARPRAVAALREQAGLAQRLRFLVDLRLASRPQAGKLPDSELLLGAQREKPEAIFIAQQTNRSARTDCTFCIYSIMRIIASYA